LTRTDYPEGLNIPLESVVIEFHVGGRFETVTQEGLPGELIDSPEVLEAFRSSFRKLGRVLSVETENR